MFIYDFAWLWTFIVLICITFTLSYLKRIIVFFIFFLIWFLLILLIINRRNLDMSKRKKKNRFHVIENRYSENYKQFYNSYNYCSLIIVLSIRNENENPKQHPTVRTPVDLSKVHEEPRLRTSDLWIPFINNILKLLNILWRIIFVLFPHK